MNLKRITISSLFLLLLITMSVSSCKKDETIAPTSAEVATAEVQKVISENNIKRVYPVKYMEVFPDNFPVDSGTTWSFSNGFIHVNYNSIIQNWNLEFLVAYNVSNVNLDDGSTTKR